MFAGSDRTRRSVAVVAVCENELRCVLPCARSACWQPSRTAARGAVKTREQVPPAPTGCGRDRRRTAVTTRGQSHEVVGQRAVSSNVRRADSRSRASARPRRDTAKGRPRCRALPVQSTRRPSRVGPGGGVARLGPPRHTHDRGHAAKTSRPRRNADDRCSASAVPRCPAPRRTSGVPPKTCEPQSGPRRPRE